MLSLTIVLLRAHVRSLRMWGSAALGLLLTWLGATLDVLGFDDPARHLLETGTSSAILAALVFVAVSRGASTGVDAWLQDDEGLLAARPGPDGAWWAGTLSSTAVGVVVGGMSLLLTIGLDMYMLESRSPLVGIAWGAARLVLASLVLSAWAGAARVVLGPLPAALVALGVLAVSALPLPAALRGLTPPTATLDPVGPVDVASSSLVALGLWLCAREASAPARAE